MSGYSWQLPQIYKRSGFDSFVTQKMSWNETTVFPLQALLVDVAGWQQGPDVFPARLQRRHQPGCLAQDAGDYPAQNHYPEIMHLYGVGDHGGGPTRQMLDEALKMESPAGVFPRTEFSTARAFFDGLEKSIADGKVNPPGVEGRTLPAVSPRLLHHAVGDQETDPAE